MLYTHNRRTDSVGFHWPISFIYAFQRAASKKKPQRVSMNWWHTVLLLVVSMNSRLIAENVPRFFFPSHVLESRGTVRRRNVMQTLTAAITNSTPHLYELLKYWTEYIERIYARSRAPI